MRDLPASMTGLRYPFPTENLEVGTTLELRFNGQCIRRGIVLYPPGTTTTWMFYPQSFGTTKLVRGELPTGHQLFEGIPTNKVPSLELYPLGTVYESFKKTLPFAIRVHLGEAKSAVVRNSVPQSSKSSNSKRYKVTTSRHQSIKAEADMQWGEDIEIVASDLPCEVSEEVKVRKPRGPSSKKNLMNPLPLNPSATPPFAQNNTSASPEVDTRILELTAAVRQNTDVITNFLGGVKRVISAFATTE